MIDRFNAGKPPAHQPFDDPNFYGYQGGKFSGVRAQLPYIKALGAGAIWLSPVLKNLAFASEAYHGYGIHDFLHAEPRFADQEHKLLEDLLRILNILYRAERDGRSNLATVLRQRAVEVDKQLPPEVWIG